MDNSFFKIKDQTARRGAERVLLAVFCVFFALIIALGAGASTFLPAMAAEYTAYDRTAIEDDLRGVDISAYPADENGRHFLLDDVGFMEYGYSESAFIVDNYFGIYLYVYNPTEREVSTRAGANVVNMATSYDAEGEPTNYENVSLTVLDHTENHRFYKFRITDSSAIYTRANLYARAHDGVRRYDVAGIQLWFLGDQNATDSFTERNEKSVTYRCTGYAAGCDEDGSEESTLKIQRDKLESVKLDVQKTFWRTETSSLGYGHQNQLDTVYFTVPQELFDEYGELQRIKAEWWEYKTKKIFVTSDQSFYNDLQQYIGYQLPVLEMDVPLDKYDHEVVAGRFDPSIPLRISTSSFGTEVPKDAEWNYRSEGVRAPEWEPYEYMPALYYIFGTTNWGSIDGYDPYADIVESGGVTSNALEEYIFGYNKTFDSGELNVKDGKVISADLFEADIDESRKVDNDRGKIQMGYSYYDFDIDEDVQEIVSWEDGSPTWWETGFEYGFWEMWFGDFPKESGRTFAPIYIPKAEDFAGTAEEIADRLMCQVSEVERLRAAFEKEGEVLVLFRFAVSDYYAADATIERGQYYDDRFDQSEPATLSDYLWDYKREEGGAMSSDARITDAAYLAQQSVFLNFDIIQLTFNDSGDMTVIPVVSDPIDIIDPITPPVDFGSNYWTLVWWLLGIMVGTVSVGILGTMAQKMSEKKGG